jgi:hypothetical protein
MKNTNTGKHAMNIPIPICMLSIVSLIVFAGGVSADTVIYSHSFGGLNTTSLNGDTVDTVESGYDTTWSANTLFNADGSFDSGGDQGAAILDFTPTLNQQYRFEVSFSGMSNGYDSYNIGFVSKGLDESGDAPFATSPRGFGWLQVGQRKKVMSRGAQAFATQVINDSTDQGPAIASVVNTDVRIDLKRVGDRSYDIAFYLKDQSDASYTALGAVSGYSYSGRTISGVGFGIDDAVVNTTGTIDSFTLTAISEPSTLVDIPEPSTLGLVVVAGMVAMLRRSRANLA